MIESAVCADAIEYKIEISDTKIVIAIAMVFQRLSIFFCLVVEPIFLVTPYSEFTACPPSTESTAPVM
jgi:hypothetical protein